MRFASSPLSPIILRTRTPRLAGILPGAFPIVGSTLGETLFLSKPPTPLYCLSLLWTLPPLFCWTKILTLAPHTFAPRSVQATKRRRATGCRPTGHGFSGVGGVSPVKDPHYHTLLLAGMFAGLSFNTTPYRRRKGSHTPVVPWKTRRRITNAILAPYRAFISTLEFHMARFHPIFRPLWEKLFFVYPQVSFQSLPKQQRYCSLYRKPVFALKSDSRLVVWL